MRTIAPPRHETRPAGRALAARIALFTALSLLAPPLAVVACGPVVAPPSDEADAGARPAPVDLCDRPGAPGFCNDAGVEAEANQPCSGEPDGVCWPEREGCACADCAGVALCVGACLDDGACDRAGGEDCSCGDCKGKVEGCAPAPVGCKDNGVCSPLEDDCTCADCRDDRGCQGCVVDGFCAGHVEGCGCADCAEAPGCAPQ